MSGQGAERRGVCDAERESEFTGLKGTLLRYAGCTYMVVLLGQLVEMLSQAWWCPEALAPVLAAASAAMFPLAFAVYPVVVGIRRALSRLQTA